MFTGVANALLAGVYEEIGEQLGKIGERLGKIGERLGKIGERLGKGGEIGNKIKITVVATPKKRAKTTNWQNIVVFFVEGERLGNGGEK